MLGKTVTLVVTLVIAGTFCCGWTSAAEDDCQEAATCVKTTDISLQMCKEMVDCAVKFKKCIPEGEDRDKLFQEGLKTIEKLIDSASDKIKEDCAEYINKNGGPSTSAKAVTVVTMALFSAVLVNYLR